MRMGAREWGMLLVLSLLWGGSFLFVGLALRELGPLTVVALRVGGAALMLWTLLALFGRLPRLGREACLAFLVMGLLNNALPFSLIAWGQTQIASGLAAILNATTPIFTVLLAHALTDDERLTRGRLAGVAMGFAGVAVMMGGDALAGLGGALAAQGAVLAAAFAYACAGIFGRRFSRMGLAPEVTAAGQVTASTLLLVPLALAVEAPWRLPAPSASTVAAVTALAVLSTALAYILYFRVLRSAGATNLLLVTFLIPPSAIFLGWLVLDERLVGRHFAGLALIAAGLLAIDGRAGAWLLARAVRPGRGRAEAVAPRDGGLY